MGLTGPRPSRDVGAVVLMRMGAANAGHHLRPICAAMAPATVVIVRPSPEDASTFGPNVVAIDTTSRLRILEVLRTAAIALWITLTSDARHLISFNAIPYGILASWIGSITRTPVHVGFVGTDAHQVGGRPWLLKLFGRTDLVTTTGSAMSEMLLRHGITGRLEVLAHGVDAQRFSVEDASVREIDIVFVGGLIPRKRVTLILRAIAHVREQHPGVSAVIVGDGPEKDRLHELSEQLGLADSTRFVGHDPAPERWLVRSELLVMASTWEGLPFAIVEAMRCGVVPVVTDVGTITDLVNDGTSGVLVSEDPSVEEVGDALLALLADDERREAMRQAALRDVADMTYESLAAWWSDVLAVSR